MNYLSSNRIGSGQGTQIQFTPNSIFQHENYFVKLLWKQSKKMKHEPHWLGVWNPGYLGHLEVWYWIDLITVIL